MNPDLPPNTPAELEANLTALLLGELPAEQAAGLRQAIAHDAELAALYRRLELTIDLVREAAHPAAGQAETPAPLKLSDARREQLLAHFKTVAPREFSRPRRKSSVSPLLVGIAAVLLSLLAVAALLPKVTSKSKLSFALAREKTARPPFGTWALATKGEDASPSPAARSENQPRFDLFVSTNFISPGSSVNGAAIADRSLDREQGKPNTSRGDGFMRNQGTGPQEINLAAMLTELSAAEKPPAPAEAAARTVIVLPSAVDTASIAQESLDRRAAEPRVLAQDAEATASGRKASVGEADIRLGVPYGKENTVKSVPATLRGFYDDNSNSAPNIANIGDVPIFTDSATQPIGGGGLGYGGGAYLGGGTGGGSGRSAPTAPGASVSLSTTDTATKRARTYPNTATIGDAYFSIDPESRRVVTLADQATVSAIGKALSNSGALTTGGMMGGMGGMGGGVPVGQSTNLSWASFDGSTNAPVIGLSGPELSRIVGGGGGGGGFGGAAGGGTSGSSPGGAPTAPGAPPAVAVVANNGAVPAISPETGLPVVDSPPTTAEAAIAAGVPVLGDVPVIGRLFRNEESPSTPAATASSPADVRQREGVPGADVTELRAFPLKHADPAETADLISSLFPDASRKDAAEGPVFRKRVDGGTEQDKSAEQNKKKDQVVAVPDARTQSIVVSAGNEMMPHIAEVIGKLDATDARHETVKVYELNNADPQDVQDVLQDLFRRSDKARENSTANRNSLLRPENPLTQRMTQYQNNSTSANIFSSDFENNRGGDGSGGQAGPPGGSQLAEGLAGEEAKEQQGAKAAFARRYAYTRANGVPAQGPAAKAEKEPDTASSLAAGYFGEKDLPSRPEPGAREAARAERATIVLPTPSSEDSLAQAETGGKGARLQRQTGSGNGTTAASSVAAALLSTVNIEGKPGNAALADSGTQKLSTNYYAFDQTFTDFFGSNGSAAVEQAVALLAANAGQAPPGQERLLLEGLTTIRGEKKPLARQSAETSKLVQDGKLLYEMGKFDDAEAKLKQATKEDPPNAAAHYYENLIRDSRYQNALKEREAGARTKLATVENAWAAEKASLPATEQERQRVTGTSTSGADKKPMAKKTAEARANVVGLGEDHSRPDSKSGEGSSSPLLTAETLRPMNQRRIETEAELTRQQTLLDHLRSLPPDKLKEALLTATGDNWLGASLEQKALADQRLAVLEKNYGVGHPEVAKARSQVADLQAKIDKRVEGNMNGLAAKVDSLGQELTNLVTRVERATQEDIDKASESAPYFAEKRHLEELRKSLAMLDTKLSSEKADKALPKTVGVAMANRATPPPAENPSVLGRLREGLGGTPERTAHARVKVARDRPDIGGLVPPQAPEGAYDPYFIQTEFEVIQSERVLGEAIQKLNLKHAWAEKYGGGKDLTTSDTVKLLRDRMRLSAVPNSSLVDIGATSDNPDEAARIANAVAEAYRDYRLDERAKLTAGGIETLSKQRKNVEEQIAAAQAEVDRLSQPQAVAAATPRSEPDEPKAKPPAAPAPTPQPEVQTSENAFSTFSLNVSDVSFKLAAASLERGQMPEPASVRSEEFINAFDYRDPEAPPGVPIAFAFERARYPFAHNRDLLRFSLKTAAQGRQAGRSLNLVLLLDNSGSMERADRVRIIHQALRVLAAQLQPQDMLSVVTFARTARLWVDGVPGSQAAQVAEEVSGLTPQGGTNLEEAMNLAYQTALRHYLANGINRVVLLTDGAANLGEVDPARLKQKVEAHRQQGIALDCFGIGWEGYHDDLLEVLSRNGDGRYGFINTPEEAAEGFAGQLAGALHVAAADVKVQVEFNPARVSAYRQIGYAKHQLTKEQFRDNTVAAAEIGAAESGNALYVAEVNPPGEGPLAIVRVRYKVPGTSEYHEHEWVASYTGNAAPLEHASPALRLAATASAFSEWLVSSPFAGEVTPDRLLGYLGGVPEVYGPDGRPKRLEWMIRQAKSIAGK